MVKRSARAQTRAKENDADTLYRRLEDGYLKIEAAEQAGRDTAFLDEFWLSLLREYEQVCLELQQAS